MKNTWKTYLEKMIQEKRLQRRTLPLLAAIAVIAGASVLWQLRITGIAATSEALCGLQEHVHTDECIQTDLICGLEESEGHTHTEECYSIESVLVCQEEHEHIAECYEEVPVLVCGQEESTPHSHTADCYVHYYTCGLEEHVHTASCYADAGEEDNWQASLPAELSGNWAADTLAVAKSQLGYEESKINYTADDDGTQHGYTRYGAYYGTPYAQWDAAFVSFCLANAGVDANVIPQGADMDAWTQALAQASLLEQPDYTPQVGDIALLDNRAGIVSAVGEGTINVIGRDDNGFVTELGYVTGDARITGYAAVGAKQPEQAAQTENTETAEPAEQTAEQDGEESDSTADAETAVKSNSKTVEGDDFTITAYYDDEAGIPSNAVLQATKYSRDDAEYTAREEQAGTQFDYLFDIGFYVGDGEDAAEIEPATPVTVTIRFAGDDKQYAVTHFAESGIETPDVDSEYDAENATASVTYETDSFSPFGFRKLAEKVGVSENSDASTASENGAATYADSTDSTSNDENELAKHKYVEYNESSDTYNLTLDIAGKIGSETNEAQVDVIFVLDISGSMKRDMDSDKGENKGRLNAANSAIKTMVNSLDSDTTVDAHYALVTFSGSNDYPDTPYDDATIAQTWTETANTLTSSLPSDPSGGTNYEAGLYSANQLLSTARSNAKTVVVFLSDGDPTYYYYDGSKGTTAGKTGGNGNNDNGETCLTHAKTQLSTMNMDAFYTVGVGPSGNYTKLNAQGLLSGAPTGTETAFFEGTSTTALKEAFDLIHGNILNYACTNVTVTDTLSEYAELTDTTSFIVKAVKTDDETTTEYTGRAEKTAASNENGATVTLEDSAGNEFSTTVTVKYDGEKTITLDFDDNYELEKDVVYSITMTIQATNEAMSYSGNPPNTGDEGTDAPDNSTSSGKDGFYCNKDATVTYTYKDQTGNEETYPKPVIQVNSTLEPINFYINLASKVLDTDDDVSGRNVELFTKSVSGSVSGINQNLMMQIPSTHVHGTRYGIIVGERDDVYAQAVDKKIREELVSGCTYKSTGTDTTNNGTYKLIGDFPKDEDIFEYIRKNWDDGDDVNKDQPLTINGVAIDHELLTTENFEIRWYVCKDEGDYWHVDGILVAKTATLTVTKTFQINGEANAENVQAVVEAAYNAVPTNSATDYFDENCFYLSASGKTNNGNNAGTFKLALRNLSGVTDTDYAIEATECTTDDVNGTVTYTWEVPVLAATYTLNESNVDFDGYIYNGATYSVESLTENENVEKWKEFTQDAKITTQTFTSDDDKDKTQQVSFVNTYEVGQELPNTGGVGTTLYRMLGGCLLAIAAVSLCALRRRRP